jgi:subtilisin
MPRYVVLPDQGFTSSALRAALPASGSKTFPAAARGLSVQPGVQSVEVLDSIHEDGPKLVEMTEAAELNLRLSTPGLTVVPVVYYQPARVVYRAERVALAAAAAAATNVRIRVHGPGGVPVAGVAVVAFTDFAERVGDQGVSDAQGGITLRLRPGTRLERLYAFPKADFWGHLSQEVILGQQHDIALRPINLGDAGMLLLRRYYGALPDGAGNGVTVAVVDSGVAAAHPALPNVVGGRNMVSDETRDDPANEAEWGPAETDGEHGTHVAGIVGGHPVQAWRGVASGVNLRSYRVFPHTGGGATNFDIAKAIDRAVGDGCHIINLSLGGSQADLLVRRAIDRAIELGALVVAAAGNDGRGAVSFPAALPAAVAVSAMGRRGGFPADSNETGDIAAPFAEGDPEAFIAQFSNIGPEVDLTGPGVGIVSTVPDAAFGVMSGTSMASPAVAGFAASLLAARPDILAMNGGARSRAPKDALFQSAGPLGFGRTFEGFGLPAAGPAVAAAAGGAGTAEAEAEAEAVLA